MKSQSFYHISIDCLSKHYDVNFPSDANRCGVDSALWAKLNKHCVGRREASNLVGQSASAERAISVTASAVPMSASHVVACEPRRVLKFASVREYRN